MKNENDGMKKKKFNCKITNNFKLNFKYFFKSNSNTMKMKKKSHPLINKQCSCD
jgi:hypothetical protein